MSGGAGEHSVAAGERAVQGHRGERPAQRVRPVGRTDAAAVAPHALVGAEAQQGDVIGGGIRSRAREL